MNNPGFYVAQKAKRKELSLAAWYPFFPKKRCHPEPFLCPLQRQSTTTIPAGHKKGEGSSRAFTPSKKPSPSNNRLLLGISFAIKNAVILSPFYARCIAKPQSQFQNTKKNAVILRPFYAHYNAKQQPQSQPGIKRVKDLAELLRRPKSHAQARGACCLVSLFPKKTSRPARADRDVVNSKT